MSRTVRKMVLGGGLLALLLATFVSAPSIAVDDMDWSLREAVLAPAQKWLGDVLDEKDSDGRRFKKGSVSKRPRGVDDGTYIVTAYVNIAGDQFQSTERHELTVGKSAGDKWEVSSTELVDEIAQLARPNGDACYPYTAFNFDFEGFKASTGPGSVCARFMGGEIVSMALKADSIKHSFAPPPHTALLPVTADHVELYRYILAEHREDVEFDAKRIGFRCDVKTCEKMAVDNFTGLQLPPVEERAKITFNPDVVKDWYRQEVRDVLDARKENRFAGFRATDRPDNRRFDLFVARESEFEDGGVVMSYDNFGGWEVSYGVIPKRWDLPNQIKGGSVLGFYTKETTEKNDLYALESRESAESRFFEVFSVDGEVELATETSETLHGDVEFGLTLRQELEDIPFFLISFSPEGGSDSTPAINVNSILVDGADVTWVQTGRSSGRVMLPERMPAGSKVKIRMDWSSQAIRNYTHSFSSMPRQGWLPFVRFGDTIDEFDLVIRSPSKHTILGVGEKVSETLEDRTRVSTWTSSSPVNFPTIIFGTYETEKAKFEATKADGSVIPVRVHVDKASIGQSDIRSAASRQIAAQASNSLNLYREVSSMDYPFGELNLVNDPNGFLYGQAPSSLIYLGQGVFRGEGSLAPYFNNATGISKFLKSVVAHEVGHQWWGNLVANKNQRNYWFVETLAEYFSAVYLEAAFGTKDYQEQVSEWRTNIMDSEMRGSVQNATTSLAGLNGGDTQSAIYNKGPYAFHMLREIFKEPGAPGPEGADRRFFNFLREGTAELAAKREIVTSDIQIAAEKAFGGVGSDGQRYNMDLGWFFDQWIRGDGIPEHSFNYTVTQAEDGAWVIDGAVRQRVRLGTSDHVMEGRVYRGVMNVTVNAKGGPFVKRIVINEQLTPVKLRVPAKPVDVLLNADGEMLAFDTVYNRDW